jgi:hypothetical protein
VIGGTAGFGRGEGRRLPGSGRRHPCVSGGDGCGRDVVANRVSGRGAGAAAALLAAVATLVGADAAVAATEQPRRVAVVVGANLAPSGRTTLRYAHADARGIAAALTDVAGFAPADVHVLLDPAPEAVLERLDSALADLAGTKEALLLFYFSGHSDSRALYPAGRLLPLDELKRRLEDPRATVRVGVVDACSGGAWTGTKGLHSAEPFVVDVPFTLGAEGSALVAASSGAESAHEFERIGGSFFTHHFVAGLRGGAERNGDGVVTLGEAFEYAKAGTLRDSAIHAPSPQHPSFVMNLRGRSDLPLAHLAGAATRFDVVQHEGPLEVIRLDQALVVLEIPPGQRTATLALPPGRYVVRRRARGETFAAEVELVSGRPVSLHEESLTLVGSPQLASKGTSAPAMLATTLPAGRWEVGLDVGRLKPHFLSYGSSGGTSLTVPVIPSVVVGLGDHWQLSFVLPQVAFRLGNPGGTELVASGGVMGAGNKDDSSWTVAPGAGVAVRQAVGTTQALLASFSTGAPISLGGEEGLDAEGSWEFDAAVGWSWTLGRVTVSPAVRFGGKQEPSDDGPLPRAVILGSGLNIAGRDWPLLRLQLARDWALDGNAAFFWNPDTDEGGMLYSLGTTWTF